MCSEYTSAFKAFKEDVHSNKRFCQRAHRTSASLPVAQQTVVFKGHSMFEAPCGPSTRLILLLQLTCCSKRRREQGVNLQNFSQISQICLVAICSSEINELTPCSGTVFLLEASLRLYPRSWLWRVQARQISTDNLLSLDSWLRLKRLGGPSRTQLYGVLGRVFPVKPLRCKYGRLAEDERELPEHLDLVQYGST